MGQVHQPDLFLDHQSRLDSPGKGNDQRNPQGLVKDLHGVPYSAVFQKFFAVVCGHDDERVLAKAAFLHRVEEDAQLAVGESDLAIIERNDMGEVLFANIGAETLDIATVDRSSVVWVEKAVPRGRRKEVVMHIPKVQKNEERLVTRVPTMLLKPIPDRGYQLGRGNSRPRGFRRNVGHGLVVEVKATVVPEDVPQVGPRDEACGRIPCVPEGFGESRYVFSESAQVRGHSVGGRVPPRHHRDMRRKSPRAWGNRCFKSRATFSQLVEIRTRVTKVSVGPQMVTAKAVDRDE